MDYREFLEHSYKKTLDVFGDGELPRLGYLAEHIFDFTTYDGGMSDLFGMRAVEVCKAITEKATFQYIEDKEQYTWFLIMCNTPFFSDRIDWGTSIRGAWWAAEPGKLLELSSCGLWIGDEQITDPLKFSDREWHEFMRALIDFATNQKD